MDVIGHLTRTVSPAVLGDDDSTSKQSLLAQFYAIFAARLSDKDIYGRFVNEKIATDDQNFYDRVWTDGSHRGQISGELAQANAVDATAARGLLAMAAPLAYHEIKSLAGTTPVPQFLHDNMASYQKHLPAWASVLTATTPAAGETLVDTTSPATPPPKAAEKSSFMASLLPIIGLIILSALAWSLLRGCQENPEPVGSPVAAQVIADTATNPAMADNHPPTAIIADTAGMAVIKPATLQIATSASSNTLSACRMSIGNEALQNTVMTAMTTAFGEEVGRCRIDVDEGFTADMPAVMQLGMILQIVKSVPNASMRINGNDMVVNAPDANTLTQLMADLQAAVPAMTVSIEAPLNVQNDIDNSIRAAQTAMDMLTDNPDPHDVARALNLQIVYFDSNKAIIPEMNKPVLDRAATLITQVPDMRLMIMGHTDKTANTDDNLKLSQARAQSIKAYMVSQGANPSQLLTKGMGETDPIADNATEQGRFRNRRIEFIVYDEPTMVNTTAESEGNADAVLEPKTSHQ